MKEMFNDLNKRQHITFDEWSNQDGCEQDTVDLNQPFNVWQNIWQRKNNNNKENKVGI